MGSGSSYAIGAMDLALRSGVNRAADVAVIGVEAGALRDVNTGGEIRAVSTSPASPGVLGIANLGGRIKVAGVDSFSLSERVGAQVRSEARL